MANIGPPQNSNNTKFNPVSWMLGICAVLLTALVIALWNGSARLAVVESNTANIREAYADHEKRMRRLERHVLGPGSRFNDGSDL